MGTGAKAAVTAILVVVFLLGGIMLLASGSSKTFVALLSLGLFYGVRSMFRSGKDEPVSDKIILDKESSLDEGDAA